MIILQNPLNSSGFCISSVTLISNVSNYLNFSYFASNNNCDTSLMSAPSAADINITTCISNTNTSTSIVCHSSCAACATTGDPS